jgi:hypothetical protein
MQQRRTNKAQIFACPARCLTVALGLSMLGGCASQPSPPSSEVTRRPVPDATSSDSTKGSASPSFGIYQPGQLRYSFQISSVVQASGGDSTHRVDSTRVAGIVVASFTAGSRQEEIIARIQPDTLSITTGAGTSVPMPSSPPFVFRIDARTGRVIPNDARAPNDCARDSVQIPIQGAEALPSVPSSAREAWTDTSSAIMCRGGVRLVLSRVASYTRLQSPDSARQFLRSTHVTVSGTGDQWGQKVDVSGDGSSIDTLRLGGFPPRLQQVTGNSELRLQFRAPLKSQEFIQSAATRLQLLQH